VAHGGDKKMVNLDMIYNIASFSGRFWLSIFFANPSFLLEGF